MRLVPKLITEIVQIKSTIEALDWYEFRTKLQENMENLCPDFYDSIAEKTTFFTNTTDNYKQISIGNSLLLVATTDEWNYEILFQQVGSEVRFVFSTN